MAATLDIQLLGDVLVRESGTPVTAVATGRLISLLAYLALHRNAPQSRQHLAFLLWPNSSEAQAQSNLRNLVFQLRRSLPEAERYLVVQGRTLQWNSSGPYNLDVERFEQAVARAFDGREVDDQGIAQALKEGVELYRGDLLPGYYDEWVLTERERLHLLASQAMSRLISLLETRRDYAGAIDYSQRLLRHDPLDEGAYRTLMRLLMVTGDRAGALRTYHLCATVLERDLGVEPGHATRDAYERLLAADGTAALPGPSALERPGESKVELVGRRSEWARLQAAWRSAATGGPRAVLISGVAGIGKTRLAEDLSEWASRQGISTAVARCYAAERGLPYAPVADWLRAQPLARIQRLEPLWLAEISRLLPELLVERPDLPPPGPLTESWQQQRLHDALARALLCAQPLLLVLDDLQWSDLETLAFVSYLLRFDPSSRVLLVMTARAEELADGEAPPEALLSALRRDGALVEIEPGPLGAEDTAALARRLAGTALDQAAASGLFDDSEGNPLFVVEMVRAGLSAAPMGDCAGKVGRPRLPPAVQAAVDARLGRLTDQARDIAATASVIGREFTFDLLSRTCGMGEDELVRGLDELWRRRVVREQGPDSYDFSHDKLREVMFENLGAARRRQLHRRVAAALEQAHSSNLGPVSAQIGGHYERAGVVGLAASYYVRAAEAARGIYANAEAIQQYQQALEMVGSKSGAEAARVRESLGDLLELGGRHEEAREEFCRALAYFESPDAQDSAEALATARLLRKAGNALNGLGKYDDAEAHFARADGLLGIPGETTRAEQAHEWIEVQFARSRMLYGRADHRGTGRLLKRLRPVVQAHGTPLQRSSLAAHWSNMVLRRDRYVISRELVEVDRRALAEIEKAGDTAQVAGARFRLGFKLLFHGDIAAAGELLDSAAHLQGQIGDMWGRVLSLTYLAIAHRKSGQVESTRRCAQEALEIATRTRAVSYIGAAQANLGWAALRDGDVATALTFCSEAVELWKTTSYPFRWLAALPLVEIPLQQGRVSDAAASLRTALDPMQQRLPEPVESAANEALEHIENGRVSEARMALTRTCERAREWRLL